MQVSGLSLELPAPPRGYTQVAKREALDDQIRKLMRGLIAKKMVERHHSERDASLLGISTGAVRKTFSGKLR
jgi:hypothetical protein